MWVAAVLGVVLTIKAEPGTERLTMVIYALCITAMLGVSATYHRRRWSESAHLLMNRLDHCMIFLAIAGSYTPLVAHYLSGWQRPAVLIVVWAGAAVGIGIQWLPRRVPRWFETLVYALVGWSVVIAGPQLVSSIPNIDLWLVFLGGLAYTLGAVVYAFKRPDPWPETFGFHEVFHALTVLGAGFHAAAMWRIVS